MGPPAAAAVVLVLCLVLTVLTYVLGVEVGKAAGGASPAPRPSPVKLRRTDWERLVAQRLPRSASVRRPWSRSPLASEPSPSAT